MFHVSWEIVKRYSAELKKYKYTCQSSLARGSNGTCVKLPTLNLDLGFRGELVDIWCVCLNSLDVFRAEIFSNMQIPRKGPLWTLPNILHLKKRNQSESEIHLKKWVIHQIMVPPSIWIRERYTLTHILRFYKSLNNIIKNLTIKTS